MYQHPSDWHNNTGVIRQAKEQEMGVILMRPLTSGVFQRLMAEAFSEIDVLDVGRLLLNYVLSAPTWTWRWWAGTKRASVLCGKVPGTGRYCWKILNGRTRGTCPIRSIGYGLRNVGLRSLTAGVARLGEKALLDYINDT
jgi:hypothetical protein